MSQHVHEAVCTSVTVAVSQQRAFEVFTAQFGSWWPKEYSIGEAEMADFVVEPKSGGRWYEVGVDGTQCDTGRVTTFDPPQRLVLAWHLNENFQYDPDPAHASEVEVRFIAEDPTHTTVEWSIAASSGTATAPRQFTTAWTRAGPTASNCSRSKPSRSPHPSVATSSSSRAASCPVAHGDGQAAPSSPREQACHDAAEPARARRAVISTGPRPTRRLRQGQDG